MTHPMEHGAGAQHQQAQPKRERSAKQGDGGPTLVAPQAKSAATESAAATLLRVEAGLRQVRSFSELCYYIANEFRPVSRAQQAWVVSLADPRQPRVEAVSSLAFVDRSSPLVVEIERLIVTLEAAHGLTAPREFDIDAFTANGDSLLRKYPLTNLLWIPFLDFSGKLLGGMLQARSVPWSEQDIVVSSHLGGAATFAWLAINPVPRRWSLQLLAKRKSIGIALLAILAASVFPVSMSALAPVEVAPRDAFIVTAGVDGVVEAVDVDPNARVAKGATLVRIADTVLNNRHEIAAREVVVAEAQLKRVTQLAFSDARGRNELAVAQSELALKRAERDYAREMLQRATVTADHAGVAFFADKRDLIGRPVAVGEKLMEIVDPSSLQFDIDLPVADAIVLKPGARVKVFLDSDPLYPIEAVLVRADYKARVHANQQLGFRLVAEARDQSAMALRLGVRGTAQVYSGKTPLAFYLLRRPLAAVRQMVGF